MSTAETKAVTLGDYTYEVPPVPFNMCAKIVPIVSRTFLAIRDNKLDEESILNLGRIVYLAINKTPELTEEAFLSRAVPLPQMIGAATVVTQQANMRQSIPGEAKGAESPQTSMS